MPFQYRVHTMPLVTIPQGQIGYVFARDGAAAAADADARVATSPPTTSRTCAASSRAGGQRGPQRKILREGTYAINLAQFVVVTERARLLPAARAATEAAIFQRMAQRDRRARRLRAGRDQGRRRRRSASSPCTTARRCPTGEIIAPTRRRRCRRCRRPYPQQLPGPGALPARRRPPRPPAAGAGRGHLLHQPPVRDGRDDSEDRSSRSATSASSCRTPASTASICSGDEYKHGELVTAAQRGVWSEPLLPGKYAFNTYAGKVIDRCRRPTSS